MGLDLIIPSTDNLKLIVPESQIELPEFFSLSNVLKRKDEQKLLVGVIEKSTSGKGSFCLMD